METKAKNFVAGYHAGQVRKYICAQRKNEKTKLQEDLSILEAYESLESEFIMCDDPRRKGPVGRWVEGRVEG